MKKRKRWECLLFTAVFMMLLVCGTWNVWAENEPNLPTEFDFTLTYGTPLKVGTVVNTGNFSVTYSELGDFSFEGARMLEGEAPLGAHSTMASKFFVTDYYGLYGRKYYAFGLKIGTLPPSQGNEALYRAYVNKQLSITLNGEPTEYYYVSNHVDGSIKIYVWFNMSPEELHPVHEYAEDSWKKGANGIWERTCTNRYCGAVEKHIHTYGAWTSIVSADTTREEVQTRQCTSEVCNHESEERTIHSIHVYDSYKVVSEPTATTDGRKTGTCRVCNMTSSFVIPHLVSSAAKPSLASFPLKTGSSYTVTIENLVKTDRVVSWSSQTPAVAVVDSNGRITGLKSGTAVIQAKLASGKVLHVIVKVQKKAVKTAKLTGLVKKLTLKKGEKYQLNAVRQPVTSSEKITYTTSDKKIAAVNKKGVITARKKGKVIITVASGRKKVKIKVTVTK